MIEIIPNWHPLFVHFTVALFSLSIIFFLIQRPLAETEIGDNFLIFARYALWLGALFSVATLIAGFDAYNTVDHDTPSHSAMTDHKNWALATLAVFFAVAIWGGIVSGVSEKASIAFLILLLIGGGLLVTTGHKGSQLVYKFGLGVQSLPSKDDHKSGGGHDHGGAAGGDHHGGGASSGGGHAHDSAAESGDGHGHDHSSMESGGHDADMDMDMNDLSMPPQSLAPTEDMKMDDQLMETDMASASPKKNVTVKPVAEKKPETKVVELVQEKAQVKAPLKVKEKAQEKSKVAPSVARKSESVKPQVVSSPIPEKKPKEIKKAVVEEVASKEELVVEVESNEDNTFLIPGAGSSSAVTPKIETYSDGTTREALPAVTLDIQ